MTASKSVFMSPPPATKHEGLHTESLLRNSLGPILTGIGTKIAPKERNKLNVRADLFPLVSTTSSKRTVLSSLPVCKMAWCGHYLT